MAVVDAAVLGIVVLRLELTVEERVLGFFAGMILVTVVVGAVDVVVVVVTVVVVIVVRDVVEVVVAVYVRAPVAVAVVVAVVVVVVMVTVVVSVVAVALVRVVVIVVAVVALVAVDVDVSVVDVAVVVTHVPHITGQVIFACLPAMFLRAQLISGMVVVPHSDESGFPLHSPVVVVVEVVVVAVVVVAKHMPHVVGQACRSLGFLVQSARVMPLQSSAGSVGGCAPLQSSHSLPSHPPPRSALQVQT